MNSITMKMQADKLIRMALQEDITSEDVSTNAVMRSAVKGTVDLIAKEDGIIAGLDVYARVFQILDEKTEISFNFKDGEAVKKGDLLGTVTGDIRVLLSGERVALNYLQRMSGIATYTKQVSKLLEGSKVTLLDTRKTTPNCRVFEKYAVRIGGGCNHRYNLSDGVLLKDNHIGAAGSVAKAVAMAKEYAPFVRKIEIEVETMEQVKEAAWKGYLKPGDGLPSVRKLALQLSVTPNTVAKAYQLLEKEKVIVTIRGKGAFLAENASQEVDKGKMQEIKTSLKEILSELRYEGYDEEKIANLIHEIYQDLEG